MSKPKKLSILGLFSLAFGCTFAGTSGCNPDSPGGGEGITPFVVLRNQPIPFEGALAIQFQVEQSVRLRIVVDGPVSSAPDFQLAVGQFSADDFGNVDVVLTEAEIRRGGYAEGTFDTVLGGFYTLFVIDNNNTTSTEFDIEVS